MDASMAWPDDVDRNSGGVQCPTTASSAVTKDTVTCSCDVCDPQIKAAKERKLMEKRISGSFVSVADGSMTATYVRRHVTLHDKLLPAAKGVCRVFCMIDDDALSVSDNELNLVHPSKAQETFVRLIAGTHYVCQYEIQAASIYHPCNCSSVRAA